MKIDRFPVTDRESWLAMREQDITASVAAALFGDGVHPYVTAFELFARKSKLLKEHGEDTPLFRRGRLLEPVALELLREERPDWAIEPSGHYYRDAAARIGASHDTEAFRPDIKGPGTIQLKSVGTWAFRIGWRTADRGVEVPLWIAVQASVEAALIGATWAAVAALVLGDGGLELHVIDIPIKPALMTKLRGLVADFWRRVAVGEPYPPDYGRDAALIAKLYAEDDGAEIDLTGDNRTEELIAQFEALKAREAEGSALVKAAAAERKPVTAELIEKLGNASRARLGSLVIEAKTVRRAAYYAKASTYRNLRIIGGEEPRRSREASQ